MVLARSLPVSTLCTVAPFALSYSTLLVADVFSSLCFFDRNTQIQTHSAILNGSFWLFCRLTPAEKGNLLHIDEILSLHLNVEVLT